jgi:hypothetical protein
MRLLSVLSHHSEPTDPVLLRWLTDTIDAVLGLPSAVVVVLIAVVVLSIPSAIGVLAALAHRKRRL